MSWQQGRMAGTSRFDGFPPPLIPLPSWGGEQGVGCRRSLAAQGDDEILRVRRAGVLDAVLFVGSHVGHRARAEACGAAGDGDFQCPFADQKDFFVRMVMRGMGHRARRKVGFVHLDGVAGVGLPLHDAAKRVSVSGFNGQVFEAEELGRDWALRCQASLGHQGRDQQTEFPARVSHRFASPSLAFRVFMGLRPTPEE